MIAAVAYYSHFLSNYKIYGTFCNLLLRRIEPGHPTLQILIMHGCFTGRLRDLGLSNSSLCFWDSAVEKCRDHVLWEFPLYAEIHNELCSELERLRARPFYFSKLTSLEKSSVNFKTGVNTQVA